MGDRLKTPGRGWLAEHVDPMATLVNLVQTPEWPDLMFARFLPGDDYKSGTATLLDQDVKFQNGFSAMVRARVTCLYDLRRAAVISVKINERD